MKITILTLFPEMFTGVLNSSILKRAQSKGLIEFEVRQLRDWTADPHKTVDDRPYGGGAGMVLKADVVYRALKEVAKIDKRVKSEKRKVKNVGVVSRPTIILPTPKGKLFNQQLAIKYSKKEHLVFVCPHYEGYDERITSFVNDQVSMGEYIVTGGEIPAMMMVDAIGRLVRGVIREESLREESFNSRIQDSGFRIQEKNADHKSTIHYPLSTSFEYPQYTRPEIIEVTMRGKKIKKRVPKVLLSGNHKKIEEWRGTHR